MRKLEGRVSLVFNLFNEIKNFFSGFRKVPEDITLEELEKIKSSGRAIQFSGLYGNGNDYLSVEGFGRYSKRKDGEKVFYHMIRRDTSLKIKRR